LGKILGKPSLIVEIVGPAGAGKTTLTRNLVQSNKNIYIGDRPRIRRISHFPFFARNTLLLLPEFIKIFSKKNSGGLNSREVALMLRLRGWQQLWWRQVVNKCSIIVLDQGPIFSLAELSSDNQGYLSSQSAKKWWDNMHQKWASLLDFVIWLDAPDSILMERIKTRNKDHLVKGKPEPEITKYLTRYRMVYSQVISTLTANFGGPVLHRFDTSRESLEEIVNNILIIFGLNDSIDGIAL
jgi:shikimate kinase